MTTILFNKQFTRLLLPMVVKSLRGFTLEKFAGNLIFGLKHTLYLPDDDFSGWTPSSYFSGSSNANLVSVALGPSSSNGAILF